MRPNKQIGLGFIVVALVLVLIGFFYVQRSEEFLVSQTKTGPNGECIHTGPTCPYEQLHELTVPKFIGGFALLLMLGYGVFVFTRKTPEEVVLSKARKSAKGLGNEEAKVFDLVTRANGLLFQNELVEKAQLSKVRITRVLDKLESKGLVERKRRGMTNVVVLK